MAAHNAHFPCLLCFLSAGLLGSVSADLPIHCTMQDIAGEWTFQLGPASPVEGKLPGCGHHIPNNIESAIAINQTDIVPLKSAQKMDITFFEDITKTKEIPERHLIAKSNGEQGMWTMVFDTGLEARVGGKSLFAHFLFNEADDSRRKPKNGDNFENIKEYDGRVASKLAPKGDIYACYCDVVTTGFWHRRKDDGSLEAGCFWGAKKKTLTKDGMLKPEHMPETALVKLSPKKKALEKLKTAVKVINSSVSSEAEKQMFGTAASGDLDSKKQVLGATTFSSHSVVRSATEVADEFESHDGLVKEVIYRKQIPAAGVKVPAAISLRGVVPHVSHSDGEPLVGMPKVVSEALSKSGDGEELPKNFDWREELADMVPAGEDPLGAQVDQGPCGSCYAFAGTMMLQMRFRAQLWRQQKVLYPLELSYKSVARCSPYTEGCSGGFSYLSMRLAQEVGVPLQECDKKDDAGGLDKKCDWSCYKDNKDLFFAKDYWHVGGFSHGSDEQSIMREIYRNGPVELGFSTGAVPEFVSRSGQSVSNSTDVMNIIINDRAAKEPFSSNKAVQPWVFSTHAIMGVGWGEEDVKWGMVKYWVVRNSWGRDWGEQGYAKMRRGNNDGGIETDATMAIPDLDRLPAGFMEKARAYHKAHATDREGWRKARSEMKKDGEKTEPKVKKGTPEYCKQRPDSIDCK